MGSIVWSGGKPANGMPSLQIDAIKSGAKPLYDDIEALGQLSVPLAIVSNNQHATIQYIVDHIETTTSLKRPFDPAVGREPTVPGFKRRKPNPSYLTAVLEQLDTTNALYVGDSEKDIIAAERAGIDSAFIRRPHREQCTFDHEPTVEISTFNELVEWIDRPYPTNSPDGYA